MMSLACNSGRLGGAALVLYLRARSHLSHIFVTENLAQNSKKKKEVGDRIPRSVTSSTVKGRQIGSYICGFPVLNATLQVFLHIPG